MSRISNPGQGRHLNRDFYFTHTPISHHRNKKMVPVPVASPARREGWMGGTYNTTIKRIRRLKSKTHVHSTPTGVEPKDLDRLIYFYIDMTYVCKYVYMRICKYYL